MDFFNNVLDKGVDEIPLQRLRAFAEIFEGFGSSLKHYALTRCKHPNKKVSNWSRDVEECPDCQCQRSFYADEADGLGWSRSGEWGKWEFSPTIVHGKG